MAHSLHVARSLALSYPWMSTPFIVSAPMRVMSGPALAVAVSHAGGLGFLGPGVKTQDIITDLQEATALVDKLSMSSPLSAFRELFPAKPQSPPLLPIGVGFQLWSDDLDIAVSAIRQFKPCAAWLYAPREGQRDFDEWCHRIRNASPHTQMWIQVGTLGEAKALLEGCQLPDVLVIQGAEAGGHGRAKDGLGLMSLLPEVVDALEETKIPIFAAGGIADGRGSAAALCLGASGIVMGTRFLAASEARISRGYQREILRANDAAVATSRTLLYNKLRGTLGWPKEYSPRTIVNKSFVEYQAGRPFEELKELHDSALKEGDGGWGPEGRLATYAGAGIGLISEVKDAAAIVRDIRKETLERCYFVKNLKL